MDGGFRALWTHQELEDFNSCFDSLVEQLVSTTKGTEDTSEAMEWLKTVLAYNVPYGKKLRGLLVPLTYKHLKRSYSQSEMSLAYSVGWCIEILHSCFLVYDDIMDKGATRRGKPCWYLVDKIGAMAVNDAFFLEHCVYRILSKTFSTKAYYSDLVDLFHAATHKTVVGQNLDMLATCNRKLEDFTVERYRAIIKYKTGYYSIYLPIFAAMTMLEIKDKSLLPLIENISLQIADLYSIEDDYFDCFGDETKTGKMGTDIENCKCTWLVVTAKGACSPEQLLQLEDNYGSDDPDKVENVKKLYVELGIREKYSEMKTESIATIERAMREIKHVSLFRLFQDLIKMFCNTNDQ